MSNLLSGLGGAFVPILVVVLAIAFVLAVKYIAGRYKKIAPNSVGVFYGKKYKDGKGFHVLAGGGKVLLPLVEAYMEMSTSAFQIEIDETGIPNKDNVRLTIKGVASCQLSLAPEDLERAAQSFLGKKPDEIHAFVGNILKGHLRSIIGKMTIDAILRERDTFNKSVIEESSTELKRVGIDVINLVIQDVNDEQGYIDAMGRRAVADAKAEAETKVAEATRGQDIAVSNAQRDAALVKAANEAKVAEAEKDRDIKKANFKAEADKERAVAETAFSIAKASQDQTLKVAEAQRDAAEKTAQVEVQEKEAIRMTAQLKATQVAQAEATKLTAILNAEAAKETTILNADAEAERLKRTAGAMRDAATMKGEGEAAATRAVLLAQAEGKAAEKKQALLAEAEGTEKLAEALKGLTESGKMIIVLDRLPALFEKGGDAGAKMLSAMFGPAAAAIGQIDKISIVDMGGNGDSVSNVANIGTKFVFDLAAQAKARGFDLVSLVEKLGVDTSGLRDLLSGVGENTVATTETTVVPARVGAPIAQ